jgi:hypothetical protein
MPLFVKNRRACSGALPLATIFADQRVAPADHDGQVVFAAVAQLVGECQSVGLGIGLVANAIEDGVGVSHVFGLMVCAAVPASVVLQNAGCPPV